MTGVVDESMGRFDVLMDQPVPVRLPDCRRQTDGNAQESVQSASSRSGSNMYPEFPAIENTRVLRKKSRFFPTKRKGLLK